LRIADLKIMKLLLIVATLAVTFVLREGNGTAQGRGKVGHASICGNPQITCKTSAQFQAWDLPFRVPENAVIFDTELFYSVILKSVGKTDQDCDVFVPETERLEAQALFPTQKVFTSRCADIETLNYTNVNQNHRFMAVYAGSTLADARRTLQAVKATNKFAGATIRRMRTGFNGT
jgi:hypothetical protein